MKIGILALQGAFAEHETLLRQASRLLGIAVEIVQVRTPEQLANCRGLIIPGGESSSMALVATRTGLLPHLRAYVARPDTHVWGTCAGLILLCDRVKGVAECGQDQIGGLDATAVRNHFGRQADSFSRPLNLEFLDTPSKSFECVFIRAPVIEVAPGSRARVITCLPGADGDRVVAVTQGNLLGTSFHPELTGDSRVHEYWLSRVAGRV